MSLFADDYNEAPMQHCKTCGGITNQTIRLFTTEIPLCHKCLKEVTYRGMEKEVLKHWNTGKIPARFLDQ
jgi:hypothetical protein